MTDAVNTPLEKAGFWAMRRTGSLVSDTGLDWVMGVGFLLFVLAISTVAVASRSFSCSFVNSVK